MIKIISNKIKGTFTPLVLLSTFILIPQGTTANLVVCFGENGHINVEPVHYGVCCPTIKASLPEALYSPSLWEKSFSKNHRIPCVDIAISNCSSEQHIISAQRTIKLIKMLLLAAFAFQVPQHAEIATREPLTQPPPANNSMLASQSSIVLLI